MSTDDALTIGARLRLVRRRRGLSPDVEHTASDQTRLIVLRGNSGSGKTTTASMLRTRLDRAVALVQQDVLRRIMLKERDVAGGANIGLISQTARYALGHPDCTKLTTFPDQRIGRRVPPSSPDTAKPTPNKLRLCHPAAHGPGIVARSPR